jgi:hypothetical protein
VPSNGWDFTYIDSFFGCTENETQGLHEVSLARGWISDSLELGRRAGALGAPEGRRELSELFDRALSLCAPRLNLNAFRGRGVQLLRTHEFYRPDARRGDREAYLRGLFGRHPLVKEKLLERFEVFKYRKFTALVDKACQALQVGGAVSSFQEVLASAIENIMAGYVNNVLRLLCRNYQLEGLELVLENQGLGPTERRRLVLVRLIIESLDVPMPEDLLRFNNAAPIVVARDCLRPPEFVLFDVVSSTLTELFTATLKDPSVSRSEACILQAFLLRIQSKQRTLAVVRRIEEDAALYESFQKSFIQVILGHRELQGSELGAVRGFVDALCREVPKGPGREREEPCVAALFVVLQCRADKVAHFKRTVQRLGEALEMEEGWITADQMQAGLARLGLARAWQRLRRLGEPGDHGDNVPEWLSTFGDCVDDASAVRHQLRQESQAMLVVWIVLRRMGKDGRVPADLVRQLCAIAVASATDGAGNGLGLRAALRLLSGLVDRLNAGAVDIGATLPVVLSEIISRFVLTASEAPEAEDLRCLLELANGSSPERAFNEQLPPPRVYDLIRGCRERDETGVFERLMEEELSKGLPGEATYSAPPYHVLAEFLGAAVPAEGEDPARRPGTLQGSSLADKLFYVALDEEMGRLEDTRLVDLVIQWESEDNPPATGAVMRWVAEVLMLEKVARAVSVNDADLQGLLMDWENEQVIAVLSRVLSESRTRQIYLLHRVASRGRLRVVLEDGDFLRTIGMEAWAGMGAHNLDGGADMHQPPCMLKDGSDEGRLYDAVEQLMRGAPSADALAQGVERLLQAHPGKAACENRAAVLFVKLLLMLPPFFPPSCR